MTEPTADDIDALLRSKAGIHDLNTEGVTPTPAAEPAPPPEAPRPTALPGGGFAPVHTPPSMEDWMRGQVRVLKYGADPRKGY